MASNINTTGVRLVSAITLGLFIGLAPQAHAAEEITLKEFIAKSLSTSDTIEQQDLARKQTEFATAEKKAAFLPSLSASASANYTNSSGLGSDSRRVDDDYTATNSKLNLSQNLFNGLKDITALRAAKASQAASEFTLQEKKRSQVESALQTFFALLQGQKDRENQLKEIEINEKSLKETQSKIRSGTARANEAINLQATIASNRIDLSSTEATLEQQKAEAARLLRDSNFEINLSYSPGAFQTTQVESLFQKLDSSKRSDLLAQAANTEAQRQNVKTVEGSRLPTIDLAANYYLSDTSQISQAGQYTLGLTLTVPFPLGRETSARVEQAKVGEQIARVQEEAKKRDLEKEKIQLVKAIQADIDQLHRLEDAKKVSASNVEAMKKDSRQGLATYSDLLSASSTYQQIIRRYDRAILEFELDCYRALIWSSDLDKVLTTLGVH